MVRFFVCLAAVCVTGVAAEGCSNAAPSQDTAPSSAAGSSAVTPNPPATVISGNTAGASASKPAETPSAAPAAGHGGTAAPPTAAAGSSAAGSSGAGAVTEADRLPCDVSTVLATQCQSCHGTTTRLGAPMSLMTWADLQKPAVSDKSKKVYELVSSRVQDTTNPMPPASAGKLSAADQTALTSWITQGAKAAPSGSAACADSTAPAMMTTQQAETPMPDDAHCYDMTVHGASTATDQTPFMIPSGESYNCFYFDAPWTTPTESIAFKSKLDNDQALHHWFLYAMPSNHPNGTVEANCSPLHIDGPQMLAGWAPGGKDMAMPDGVAAEIAPPGTTLMLEWHYLNNTGAALPDRSTVSVCGVPAGSRPNTASITWLGTEDFGLAGMPAHETSSYTGTCNPTRKGLPADAPIHLLYTIPHMHQYGTHLTIDLQSSGNKTAVYDQPFSDKNQAFVETPATVMGGDSLLTTCTYNNTSNSAVTYGDPFANGEMCYAFVLYYPAHALDNGSRSLLGASNSCL